MKRNFTLLFLIITSTIGFSQSTFNDVYTILQANCVTGCHGGSNPNGNLDLGGSSASVYSNLFDITPTNPAAVGKGMKLVYPGETEKSFLYTKINDGLYDHLTLSNAEGGNMPVTYTLPKEDRELVFQWIQAGAPQTGTVIDKQMLADYYGGLGMVELPTPSTPGAGLGTQVYFGSVFLQPNEEIEYMLKRRLLINHESEVTRMETFLDGSSHHYLIYKIGDSTQAASFQDGLNEVTGFGDAFPANTNLIMAWQTAGNVDLPEHTGYFWEENPYLLLNFHVRNYSQDSILKAHVYTNMYHAPRQNNTIEMHAEIVPHVDPFFFVPNDSQDHTFSGDWTQSSNGTRYIWSIASHTHKYGVDYDIFERNSDGSKGNQIYEGFYNAEYTFNQGFYDWEHPAVRRFEPLLENKKSDGLIQEATYNNTGNAGAVWGLTTQDEMMLFYVQYTDVKPEPSNIYQTEEIRYLNFQVYPNPNNGSFNLKIPEKYKNELLSVEIYNLSGSLVASFLLNDEINTPLNLSSLSSGTYLMKLSNGIEVSVNKFTITE